VYIRGVPNICLSKHRCQKRSDWMFTCLLIKCCKYFVLCLLYITDTIPWQAVCINTTLKYNRSLEKHVLAHFQRTTCSQIYFRFSSYLLRKPLLIRYTAFICNIGRNWMIYRKQPIASELQISCVFAFFTLWKRVKTHVLSDQSVQLRIHIAV
jgi:hypothetical protein